MRSPAGTFPLFVVKQITMYGKGCSLSCRYNPNIWRDSRGLTWVMGVWVFVIALECASETKFHNTNQSRFTDTFEGKSGHLVRKRGGKHWLYPNSGSASLKGCIWRPSTSQLCTKSVPIRRPLQMQPTMRPSFPPFWRMHCCYRLRPPISQDSLCGQKKKKKKRKWRHCMM